VPVQGNNDRRLTREGMTMQKIGIMQSYVSSEKRERKAQTFQAQARGVLAKERLFAQFFSVIPPRHGSNWR
jgi:hypothetical protein